MAKCITFGKYNKNYKYIIIYIIFRSIYEYFLGDAYPEYMRISFLKSNNFPDYVIVIDIFKYFFMLILGLILLKIELKNNSSTQNDSEKQKLNENEEQLEIGLFAEEEEKKKKEEKGFVSFISRCLIVILYIINQKLSEFFSLIQMKGLDFWTVEIIFICFLNYLMFKKKIYSHQKIGIVLILFFATIMKIFNIIFTYKNEGNTNNDDQSYFKPIKENKQLFIPIGIIGYLIIYFIHALILCKLKRYFYSKFLSPSRILIYFGITGTFFSLLVSFISTYFRCKDDEFSKKICKVSEKKDSEEKYFDNFIIFFNKIWIPERDDFINIVYIILIFIKLSMIAISYYLIFMIIDIFNPEYYLCSNSSFFFITKLICLIYFLVTNSMKTDFLFEFLAQIFALIATIIYLELIEFNFCNLNFDLKKNIEIRADSEVIELLTIDNRVSTGNDD